MILSFLELRVSLHTAKEETSGFYTHFLIGD